MIDSLFGTGKSGSQEVFTLYVYYIHNELSIIHIHLVLVYVVSFNYLLYVKFNIMDACNDKMVESGH